MPSFPSVKLLQAYTTATTEYGQVAWNREEIGIARQTIVIYRQYSLQSYHSQPILFMPTDHAQI